MSDKLNCWEFRNCGMEPGGIFARVREECPVPRMMKYDGVNGGVGAGRACWTVTASELKNGSVVCRRSGRLCINCEFYLRVQREMDPDFALGEVDESISRHKIFTS